jgi:hypothetical protein
MSRAEFDTRRDEMVAEHGWTKAGVNQVWTLSRIKEGDTITVTLDTYSHVLPGMGNQASGAMEDALP